MPFNKKTKQGEEFFAPSNNLKIEAGEVSFFTLYNSERITVFIVIKTKHEKRLE